MGIINKDRGYKWEYQSIGGTSRVRISRGTDISHLSELDPKMWTVLSCPVTGLEMDDKTLAYIDADGDGKIRIIDVVTTAKWLTGVLSDPDVLFEGKDSIDLEQVNVKDGAGVKLHAAALKILENLGKDGKVISLSDTADISAVFAKTRFNGDGIITEATADDPDDKAAIATAAALLGGVQDRSGIAGVNAELIEGFYKALEDYSAWHDSAVEAPYGDRTDAAIASYAALDLKVKDFFMRSKLASFSPDSKSVLDVQTSRIEAISSENLTGKMDDIAAYPIARVTGRPEIVLSEPVNPAWAADFEVIKEILPGKETLSETDWTEIGNSFSAYTAWKAAKAGAAVESLGIDAVKDFLAKNRKESLLALVAQDSALAEEAANIDMVDKFLHLKRDFVRFLRNFVTLNDFYDKAKVRGAIFQSGRLIIDQRECHLCMKVADMAKHNASAAVSGMYLIYCDCTTKSSAAKLNIVAAMTVGEVGDIFVGKNAVYYDNSGVEWDAVITKIIDNPISVPQAFWSPYRRMATAVENLVNKSAADKDAKLMAEANAKINSAPASLPASPADATKPADAPPFDIAKFAGIFAAIGMAVGMIGTALVKLAEGVFALKWWQLVLVFIGLLLLISGPAMVMAWLKLRRRNLAPLLNANGWAVNAASKIGIPFGETLTDVAKYPKLKLKDPYAKKGLAAWQKWLIAICSIIVIICGLWLFNLLTWAGFDSPLPRYHKEEVVTEAVEEVTDSLSVTDTATVELPAAE